jgi:hypothetical protein
MLPWGICTLSQEFREQHVLCNMLTQAVTFARVWEAQTAMERNHLYGCTLYQPEPDGIAIADQDAFAANLDARRQEEHFLRKINRRCGAWLISLLSESRMDIAITMQLLMHVCKQRVIVHACNAQFSACALLTCLCCELHDCMPLTMSQASTTC